MNKAGLTLIAASVLAISDCREDFSVLAPFNRTEMVSFEDGIDALSGGEALDDLELLEILGSGQVKSEEIDRVLSEGSVGDAFELMSKMGIDKASDRERFFEERENRQEKIRQEEELIADYKFLANNDLELVNDLINSGIYKGFGGTSAILVDFFGLRAYSSSIGDAQVRLEMLRQSSFIQNIDRLKELGLLSDSEYIKLKDPLLFHYLPNKDGEVGRFASDADLLEMLTELRDAYTSATSRYSSGKINLKERVKALLKEEREKLKNQ